VNKIKLKLRRCKFSGIRRPFYYLEDDKDKRPVLCRVDLEYLFTLPESVETPFTVVIHNKPMPESYRVSFRGSMDVFVHHDYQWNKYVLSYDADKLTDRLGLRSGSYYWVALHWYE
jgi:hypothetical protein